MAASPVAPEAAEARHAIALRANAIRMKKMQRKGVAKTDNGLFLPSPNLMASALTHFSGSSTKSKSKSSSSTNLQVPTKSDALGSLPTPSLQKTLSAPPSVDTKGGSGLSQTSLPFLANQPTGVAMALAALQQANAPKSFPNLASLFPYLANRAPDPLGSLLAQLQSQRVDQTSQLLAVLLQANKSVPAGSDMLETVAQLLVQRYAAQQQQQQQQQSLLQQLLNPSFQKPSTQNPLWQPEVQIPEHDASLSGPSDSSESDGGCLLRNASSDESGEDAPLVIPANLKQRLESSVGVSTSGFESCSIQTDGWGSELWAEDDLSALLGPVGRTSLPEGNLDPMTWREPQPDDGSPRNWVPTTPPTSNAGQHRAHNDSSSVGSPGTCGSSPGMSSSVAPTPVKNNTASVEALINALAAASAPDLIKATSHLSYPGLTNLPPQEFAPGSFVEAVASAATLSAPPIPKAPLSGIEALQGLVESLTQQQNSTAVTPVSSLLASLGDRKPPVRPAMSAFSAKPVLSTPPRKAKPPSLVESKATEVKSGDQKRGPFSEEEDRLFLGKLAEYGRKITFKKMTQFFPGRTERQLRRRWVRLKRKHSIMTISGVQEVLDRLPPIPKEAGPITLDQLVECFKLPMQDACQKLSAGRPQVLTTQRFRQLFQKYGIARWPYRQVMAGRPIPEILRAAEEERARRKHLEGVCLARKSATVPLPWRLPAVTADVEEEEDEDMWAHGSDDDTSDDEDEDSELLDAELDGLQSEEHRSKTPPLRTHSFGGFPSQLQPPPLSRCSSVINPKRTAGIAIPSLHNFLPTSPVKAAPSLVSVKEEKGSSKGGTTFAHKAPPQEELFSDLPAEMFLNETEIAHKKSSGDLDWQSMLVDELENSDKGPMKRSAIDPVVGCTLSQEEGAPKRTKSC